MYHQIRSAVEGRSYPLRASATIISPLPFQTGGRHPRPIATHLQARTRTLQIRIQTRAHPPPVQAPTRRIRQGGERGRYHPEDAVAANRRTQGHSHAAVHRGDLARAPLIHAAGRPNIIPSGPDPPHPSCNRSKYPAYDVISGLAPTSRRSEKGQSSSFMLQNVLRYVLLACCAEVRTRTQGIDWSGVWGKCNGRMAGAQQTCAPDATLVFMMSAIMRLWKGVGQG
jgi:hypothetical protein